MCVCVCVCVCGRREGTLIVHSDSEQLRVDPPTPVSHILPVQSLFLKHKLKSTNFKEGISS